MRANVVCVSHLGWNWVYQRPQHIMSRLAPEHQVLYVEEPRIRIGPTGVRRELVSADGLAGIVRHTYRSDADTFWKRIEEASPEVGGHPSATSRDIAEGTLMFDSFAQPDLEAAVVAHAADLPDAPMILWLYTPAALRFIDVLQPDVVVYDVMDDLTSFRFAPASLRRQRDELLERADVVFAGGPTLHDGVRTARPDAHLFPSGVDRAHFARALVPRLEAPPETANVRRPVIGYIGVVDERVDLDLIRATAELRPEWTWLIVGPVTKIEKHRLPSLPNIRYLGQQAYDDLPRFLRVFDVAAMPFALNEATRSISPTKTLEYLAARRPVVSTRVPDVVTMYGPVVRLADDAAGFVQQVEAALAEDEAARARTSAAADALLDRYAWDRTVAQMHDIVGRRC